MTTTMTIGRLFSRAAAMLVLMLLTTITAWADNISTYYVDASGTRHDVTATVLTGGEMTSLSEGWYAVSNNVTVSDRITCAGEVNLILCDDATLTAQKGIAVNENNSLTIYGQSVGNGTLKITGSGSDYNAGIGGDEGSASGVITINGGTVSAITSSIFLGAGIGGAYQCSGYVVIRGGNVTANSIGGGLLGGGSVILNWTNISDCIKAYSYVGTVSLEKEIRADGILIPAGSMIDISTIAGKTLTPPHYYDITIDNSIIGGIVTAKVDGNAVSQATDGVTVTLDVTSTDGFYIGTASYYDGTEDREITPDNGVFSFEMPDKAITVTADFVVDYFDEKHVERTQTRCTGITKDCTELNPGWYFVARDVTVTDRITCNGNVHLILCDGATLTAREGIAVNENDRLTIYGQSAGTGTLEITGSGSDNNAGLGGDENCAGGLITINSGTVNVNIDNSSAYAAAIGGGENGDGFVYINGGTVSATTSSSLGAGIGGSDRHSGYVVIKGGNVTASSIGGGDRGGGSTLLSWTNMTDYIKADRYVGSVTLDKDFLADGILIPAGSVIDKSTIAGKTLTPPFTITYNLNGGTNNANNPAFYVPDNGDITLAAPTRDGYVFAGWTGTGLTEPTMNVTIANTSTGNRTYTATWAFVLADGTAYDRTSDEEVVSATYRKTLGSERKDLHQAWLVPFDYTLTAADLEKFTFYKINMIANSPSPSQEASNAMWVFLTRLDAGAVLHANMPYVYKPKEAVTDYEFTTLNTTLKAKETDVIAKTETLEDIYSFYATYENTTATTADPFYYVGIDGTISYGDNVTVGPQRWIIRKTSKFGNTPAYVREMHFYDGEDDATGVIEVKEVKEVNGANDDSWYTLDGRKLNGKPTKAGLYIVGGRKVLIK